MKLDDSKTKPGGPEDDASQGGQTFEQALQGLESIVDRLEGGDLTLEESIKAYEEGVKLGNLCSGKLDEAERRVEILAREADGKSSAVPFSFEDDKSRFPERPGGDREA